MGFFRDLFLGGKAVDIVSSSSLPAQTELGLWAPSDGDRAQRAVTDNFGVIDYWSPIPVVDAPTALIDYDPNRLSVENIWRTQPNVRKVVDFIARNVASIPLHVYERASDDDRPRVRDGELATLIASPQPRTAPFRFWHAVLSDALLYDRWAAVLTFDQKGARRLQRIPAARLRLDTDPLGNVTRARFFARPTNTTVGASADDDTFIDLDLDTLIFDHGYAPFGAGLSPMVTLASVLQEAAEAVAWRRQVWARGARASGWIERGVDPEIPEWDEVERQRFIDKFDADMTGTGPRAGGFPLLEDGMKLHDFKGGFTPQDTQDIEGRRLSAIEVAAAFHIAPELVGAQQGNYSNLEVFRQMLYRDSLGPHIASLEQTLNAQLVPMLADSRPLYVEANLEAKLRGSFEEQAKILQTATGGPWLTRNEARARLNMPRIEGGDELVVPMNVTEGGQASPTDSAPPPKARDHEATQAGGN